MKRKQFFVNYIVNDRCKSVTVEAFGEIDVFSPRMSAILVAAEFAVTREEVERIITKGD